MYLTPITKLIENRVSNIEYEKRKLSNLRLARKSINATTQFMEMVLNRFTGKLGTVSNWVDSSGYSQEVTLCIDIQIRVTSLTTGPLAELLRFLMEADCDAKPTTDSVGDTFAYRTFKFERPASDTMCPVKINVYAKVIDGEDATCRKVQVGTETKEVAKYEIKCD